MAWRYFIPASVSNSNFERLMTSETVITKGAVNAAPRHWDRSRGVYMFVEDKLPEDLVQELKLEPPLQCNGLVPESWRTS
ncbi:MAG: hypothetical protein A2920_00295 [Candidatus Zambryskibacteria bacterium RIFCSPLOWO2_01_FULL_43_17]|uniref:Uncharacterized protein n=1 Tax=Candidatus Zambryskibacteria bacterium RIFCSPLOWO2_01_FULL_43_17 TaxID=1802760 RepID=A0A1G2U0F0_9BACT|nr:MAG: hypothetical protein A2920_00295 [Candidatus Zambryskibacteria bacterium RIFCSPLOWO2_01_FULL_43_17]